MSESVIRVLYLAHTFQVGGAEEMVLTLARRLPRRFVPSVCAIHSAGPIGEEIRRTGVRFDVLGLTPGMRRPWDIAALRTFLVRTRPHIVHTFLLTASLYGRLAAILARVPVVIGSEVNVYAAKQRMHIAAERWLMRGTDAVVASAASVRDHYVTQVDADPAKVPVIFNAVDWDVLATTESRDVTRACLGIGRDTCLLTIIARLTPQKAHHVLLEAISRAPDLNATHLLVVGDGELRADLGQRVGALGLSARVHFAGARRDLGNVLAASDVFVMPSLWEGLPLSLVLAMGAGLPVVATRVAGIPEVVEDGRTGLLVDPGQVEPLARALSAVALDVDLRQRLGAAAQAFVRPRFGADRYVASITTLYDRLLGAERTA